MDQSSERGEVFAPERQDRIARIVDERGRARVAELAALFDVSAVTIRKDLLALETMGRVIRAHGGAIAPGRNRPESAFEVRERLQQREKELIGAAAAAMVVDGESIALDASTTALAVARHLKARGSWVQLTVVTNGLRTASELAGHAGITVAIPGGFVRWEALSVVGPLGAGIFERINVQKAFMGAAGFSIENGLSDATDEEAQIKRLMVGTAREVIAVVDHTKWQRAAFATFCRTEQLTAVVCDDQSPPQMLALLRKQGIDVRIAVPEDVGRAGARSTSSKPLDGDPRP